MVNKIKIKHVDGFTDVMANVHISSTSINLEYKYQGMDYGRTIDILEAVRMGIIECDHSFVQPILGFENNPVGEHCLGCGKDTFHYKDYFIKYSDNTLN